MLTLLIGSYTDGFAGAGIYRAYYNPETGHSRVELLLDAHNPTCMVSDPAHRYLYTITESVDASGEISETSPVVSAYARTAENGLQLINRQPTVIGPVHISWLKDQDLIVSGYTGGEVCIHPVKSKGDVGLKSTTLCFPHANPEHPRQRMAHVHYCKPTADGRSVLVANLGGDMVYRIACTPQSIHGYDFCHTGQGSGPRHITISDDGHIVWVNTELSNELLTIRMTDTGLELLHRQAIMPVGMQIPGQAAGDLQRIGNHLYITMRRGNDGIAVFSLNNPVRPVLQQFMPTELHPRALTVFADYLFVACRDSHTVMVFRRDIATGALSDTGHRIAVPAAAYVIPW